MKWLKDYYQSINLLINKMKNGFIKNNRINDIINIDDEFVSIYNKMEFSN